MKKSYFILAFLFLRISFADAQNWMRDMRDPRVNFFTVQQEFNDWWAINGQQILNDTTGKEGEKGEAWKLYKRWESDMLPCMVAANGVRLGPVNTSEKNFYRQQRAQQTSRSAANWAYIGAPRSFDDGQGDSSAGRVNCVRFDPVDHHVIYCGTPTGGLWKSSDFGSSWQLLNTDNLPQIGVSDIAINPLNPNTIYIATGDIANSACLSIGILKSVNGGQTWDTTGMSFTTSQGRLMARLLMSPLDSNTMYAATNTGIFKTTNGGSTWAEVDTVYGLTGMEFNPANPNTIYAWGSQLYKSVDAGATWNTLSTGLPNALSSAGFGVGLTPADTSCIYVLVSDTAIPAISDLPYKGVYRSLNAGNTFTRQSVSPDETGTQGTYDLAVGVSPVNKNVVVIGAVNCNYSTDGGVTWHTPAFSSHVDHHDIRFFNGSGDTVFSANDGGLFISADGGNNWQGLNNGMHIGEIYNISSGSQTKYLYLSGRQDEGTLLQNSSSEQLLSGGDGLKCLIDPLNENHMLGSIQNGVIGSSNNGGQGGITILVYNWGSGINGPGAWNTPYALQNDNSAILYVAKDYIYRSTDAGNTWSTLHSPLLHAPDNLYQLMALAPSDPKYIYAATYYHLYRSADGGNTFTNITGSLNGLFTSLAVSETNPKEIWIGFAGNSAELLHSVDAGSHFAGYATGLPAGGPFHPKSIAPVRNSKNALYASLSNAGGIYYRDSTMSSWMPFGSGLPNVTVEQLEIDYCVGKIRAATYGRDIWETDPYQPLNVPPTANATYVISEANCPDTVSFTDHSNFNPTAWQWYFPGGQPASSNAQNPVVVYPHGNTYSAIFIASNAYGADTVQYSVPTNFCTGINQLAETDLIGVYPNPGNGNFILSVTGEVRGKVTMTVIDNIGQNIYQSSYNKDADVLTATCSLPGLAKGIYYLRIITEGGNTVQKLVISGP